MTQRIRRSLLASTLSLLSITVIAEDTELGAITVTATRSEEKNTTIPASISTKDQAEIALDTPILQKELLNSMAGVRITQTGSTIGHMTSIRMPTNTGPYYLMLQDGIPVQSSGFFNHNGLAYTNYSSAGATEVLKGAGTALYGSDAVAATINVLSTPIPEKKTTSVRAEGGSDGFFRVGASAGGYLSDTVGVLGGFSHAEADGWREHTRHKRDEVSFNYTKDTNDSNTLKTLFSANRSRAEMSGSLIGRDAFENNTTSVGNIAETLNQGIAIERKFDFARLSTEWSNEATNGTQFNTIAYLRNNRNRYIVTWEDNLPQNDSHEKSAGVLFKADREQGKWHFITGLDSEYTQATREYTQLFDYEATRFGRTTKVAKGKIYDYDVNYFSIAPYLRSEYDISETLQLAGGLRYDVNRFEYSNNVADGQYAESSYSRASDDNDPIFRQLSPKLDLSYKPRANQLFYARYASGFRIPQASRLYSLRTNNSAFTLDPETTDTFEIGFKATAKRHEFAATLYHMSIDDTIVRRENAVGERFYINGDKTTHQGIELSLASKLSPQFSTKFAYSYAKHEYDNDAVFGNNEQASAPNTTANIRVNYQPKQVPGLTAMIEVEHVGSWWLDDENTKKYEGSDVANLKLSYAPTKQLKLFAKVNNVTDALYAEAATISFGKERYTPGAPRQAFIGMEYQW